MVLVVIPLRINISNNSSGLFASKLEVVIPFRINISNNRLFVYT